MKKVLLSFIMLLLFTITWRYPQMINAESQNVYDSQSEQYLTPLLQALKNRDEKAMYKLWIDKSESEESSKLFEMLFDLWDGENWDSTEKLGEKKRNSEGSTPGATIYRYKVKNGTGSREIEFSVIDDSNDIDWIHITADIPTPRLLTLLHHFSGGQWFMAVLAVAEVLFSLYVTFLCIKKKPRLWGCWLAFILTIYGGIIITLGDDVILTFFFRTLTFPKILEHQKFGTQVYVSVPVGAIIFLIKNRVEKSKRAAE
ncbi:hypothetical protein [Clostridium sp. HBUAS56010]|uniref:hypothetical protein n=1 Tax=Clostridium sp. HBUAS56010 TaxID=2571127 RepID=UPI00117862E2|nr:hypothetical protein [Clostridium sp. HBUAS56010]